MNVRKLILSIAILGMTGVAYAQESNEVVPFQLSFITPLGTNGVRSNVTTNKVSINLLGGYSKGNTGFEMAGLYNVNLQLTQGVQLSGILNASGKGDHSLQFAGIANANREQVGGTQFGGIINVAGKGFTCLQCAGIANATINADIQIGGIVNTALSSRVQLAGIINCCKAQKNGTQIAGILNAVIQGDSTVQCAGIGNIAKNADVQVGGILNIAKHVRGSQIGLINISEDCGGVPVGLISIVKNGGKHEFEVSFSDALHTAVSFKLGVDRFYTIFSAGANYIDQPVQYALGCGFGTQWNLKNSWSNQLEVMEYELTENKKFHHKNSLVQLKYTFAREIAPHFNVFAGPVLNMTISDYVDPETGKKGCSLSPYTIWDNNGTHTKLNSWIGVTAGIRF